MEVTNLLIYAEVAGKLCVIRSDVPVDVMLSLIATFSKNNTIDAVPLKDVKLKQLTEDDILDVNK